MKCRILTLALFATAALVGATVAPGDAERGRSLFGSLGCIECHQVSGQGDGTAPDLGERIGRSQTPVGLAATLWNHAPAMWAAMEGKGIQKPELSPEEAADLFAFFHAAGYFERPGDAGRGKRVFEQKGCAGCHALAEGGQRVGPAVSEWQSLQSTVALAGQMWNHAVAMDKAMTARGFNKWPQLSPQEMTDLLVYVRHVPGQRGEASEFKLSSVEEGRRLLSGKGCVDCHSGVSAYGARSELHTVTSFAAAMWNHAQQMQAKRSSGAIPQLEQTEMEAIVGALWFDYLYSESGNPGRGQREFTEKGCAGCHETASGLAKTKQPLRAFGMVSALWRHGPQMKSEMDSKGVRWPRFSVAEMSNLLAYLNSLE